MRYATKIQPIQYMIGKPKPKSLPETSDEKDKARPSTSETTLPILAASADADIVSELK